MRTYSVCNVVLIVFGAVVCMGSVRLGFGSFSDPGAGFMPILCSLFLIALSAFDLVFGVVSHWETDRKDEEIWADIDWGRLVTTVAMLTMYTILLPLVGFCFPTVLLLLFLFRLIERRSWWRAALWAVVVTAAFYLGFGLALGAQLPKGVLGL
ncbi:MAG TPA: tripartite tricarboxylate transporter TctB family protein [Syntrophorhabdaceae bacterium]|nr:tripartite tricarboxylate transporter TctB family protein [Syntrophorhabdaceae bacterium]